MLATAATTEKEQGKDAFNVVPTLLLMGKEPAADIKRHIVRAIDNLSSNGNVHIFYLKTKEITDKNK